MPLAKSAIKRGARSCIIQNQLFNLTTVEQRRAILKSNQLIDLFYEIRNDGFFTGISYSDYQKEFVDFSRVQSAIGLLHNYFINVVQPGGNVFLLGTPNRRSFQLNGDQIAMILFWSYTSTAEFLLCLLKKVIDFHAIDQLMFPHNNVPKTSDKLTLRTTLTTLEMRYATKAFVDVNIDLRNKISHYDFSYFQHRNSSGIKCVYYDNQGFIGTKRYSLQKIMYGGKNMSILLAAASLTISPSFF